VILNGDVKSLSNATKMHDYTGCKGSILMNIDLKKNGIIFKLYTLINI